MLNWFWTIFSLGAPDDCMVMVFFYDRKEELSFNAVNSKKTKQFLSYLSEQRQRTCPLEGKTNAISRNAKNIV